MKGAIIYKGKYGATLQYADWLAKALNIPVFDLNTTTVKELQEYDYLLLGSSVYIGEMMIKNWVNDHVAILKNKKLGE